MIFAGPPATTEKDGTSFVTTLFAAMTAPSSLTVNYPFCGWYL